ncbi:MAG: FUSC family protein [Candidatus Nanopelagicales bacterium]
MSAGEQGTPGGIGQAPSHPVRKVAGMGAVMVIMMVGVFVPPLVAGLLGFGAVAGSLVLPTVAALIPAMLGSLRASLIGSAGLTVASALGFLASGNAPAAALVMAATSLLMGITCRWGLSKSFLTIPITVGFMVSIPPTLHGDRAVDTATIVVATLAATLWGCAVGWLLSRRVPSPHHSPEEWSRTWMYAATLAVLTGIAAFFSTSIAWGHGGAWFILTVTVVFQPYLNDAAQRSWQRALGTVIGVIVVYGLHVIIPATWMTLVVGEILMLVSMYLLISPQYPYWLYTAVLTPAILLLVTGSSPDFLRADVTRLVATLAGAGLAMLAVAILTPFYRAGDTRAAASPA